MDWIQQYLFLYMLFCIGVIAAAWHVFDPKTEISLAQPGIYIYMFSKFHCSGSDNFSRGCCTIKTQKEAKTWIRGVEYIVLARRTRAKNLSTHTYTIYIYQSIHACKMTFHAEQRLSCHTRERISTAGSDKQNRHIVMGSDGCPLSSRLNFEWATFFQHLLLLLHLSQIKW